MSGAQVIRSLETQIRSALKITGGFKIVFEMRKFQILIWVYDQKKNRINAIPVLFAEVQSSKRIFAEMSPDVAKFYVATLLEEGLKHEDLTRGQATELLLKAIIFAYRQFGTFPPSLNGLE